MTGTGSQHGPQPLDAEMNRLGLDNHALVEASGEHLTHKEVAKGRRGRQLTSNLVGKIVRAMNRAAPRDPPWVAAELFTYVAGRRDRAFGVAGDGQAGTMRNERDADDGDASGHGGGVDGSDSGGGRAGTSDEADQDQ